MSTPTRQRQRSNTRQQQGSRSQQSQQQGRSSQSKQKGQQQTGGGISPDLFLPSHAEKKRILRQNRRQAMRQQYNTDELDDDINQSGQLPLSDHDIEQRIRSQERAEKFRALQENRHQKTRSEMIQKEIAEYEQIGSLPDNKFLYLDALQLDEPVHPDELEDRYLFYGGAKVFRQAIDVLQKRGEPKLINNIDREIKLVSQHHYVQANVTAKERAVEVLEHQLFDEEIKKLQTIGALPYDNNELQQIKDLTYFRLKEAVQDYRDDKELASRQGIIDIDSTEQIIDEFLGHNIQTAPPDSLLHKMGISLPEDDYMDQYPIGDKRALILIDRKLKNSNLPLNERDLEHVYNAHLYKHMSYDEQMKMLDGIKKEIIADDMQKKSHLYEEYQHEIEVEKHEDRLQSMMLDHADKGFNTIDIDYTKAFPLPEKRKVVDINEKKRLESMPKLTEAQTLTQLRTMLHDNQRYDKTQLQQSRQNTISKMIQREQSQRHMEDRILNSNDNLGLQDNDDNTKATKNIPLLTNQREIRQFLKKLPFSNSLAYHNADKNDQFHNGRSNQPTSWKQIKNAVIMDHMIDQERKNMYFDMEWTPEITNLEEVDRYNVPPIFGDDTPKPTLKRKPDWNVQDLIREGENTIDNLQARIDKENELNKPPTRAEIVKAWQISDGSEYEWPKAKDLDFNDPRWFEKFYHKPHMEGDFEVYGDYESYIYPHYEGNRRWHAMHSHLPREEKYMERFRQTYENYDEFVDEMANEKAITNEHFEASANIFNLYQQFDQLNKVKEYNNFLEQTISQSTISQEEKSYAYNMYKKDLPIFNERAITMLKEVVPNLSTNELSPEEIISVENDITGAVLIRSNPQHPLYENFNNEYNMAIQNKYGQTVPKQQIINGTTNNIDENDIPIPDYQRTIGQISLQQQQYEKEQLKLQQLLQTQPTTLDPVLRSQLEEQNRIKSQYPLLSPPQHILDQLQEHEINVTTEQFLPRLTHKSNNLNELEPNDLWVAPPDKNNDSIEKQEFKRLLKNRLDNDPDGKHKATLLQSIKNYEEHDHIQNRIQKQVQNAIFDGALRDIEQFHPSMTKTNNAIQSDRILSQNQLHDEYLQQTLSEEEYNEYRQQYPYRPQFDPRQNEIVTNMLEKGLQLITSSQTRENTGNKTLIANNLLQKSKQLNNMNSYLNNINNRLQNQFPDIQHKLNNNNNNNNNENELNQNKSIFEPLNLNEHNEQEQLQLANEIRNKHIEHMNHLQQLKQDLLQETLQQIELRKVQKVINYWTQDDRSPNRIRHVIENLPQLIDEFDELPKRQQTIVDTRVENAFQLQQFAQQSISQPLSNEQSPLSPYQLKQQQYNEKIMERRQLLNETKFEHESQYIGQYDLLHDKEALNGINITTNPYYGIIDPRDTNQQLKQQYQLQYINENQNIINMNNYQEQNNIINNTNNEMLSGYSITRRDINRIRDRNIAKTQNKLQQWNAQQHLNRVRLRERLQNKTPMMSTVLNELIQTEQQQIGQYKPQVGNNNNNQQQLQQQQVNNTISNPIDKLNNKLYEKFQNYYDGARQQKETKTNEFLSQLQTNPNETPLTNPAMYMNNALQHLLPNHNELLQQLQLPSQLLFPHQSVKDLIHTAQQQLAQSFARNKTRHLVARKTFLDQHDLKVEHQLLYDQMIQTRNNYVQKQKDLMSYLSNKRNLHTILKSKLQYNSMENVLSQQLFHDIHDYFHQQTPEIQELMDLTRNYGDYLPSNINNIDTNNILNNTNQQQQLPTFLHKIIQTHEPLLRQMVSPIQQRRFIEDAIWKAREELLQQHLIELPNKIVKTLFNIQQMLQHPLPSVIQAQLSYSNKIGQQLAQMQQIVEKQFNNDFNLLTTTNNNNNDNRAIMSNIKNYNPKLINSTLFGQIVQQQGLFNIPFNTNNNNNLTLNNVYNKVSQSLNQIGQSLNLTTKTRTTTLPSNRTRTTSPSNRTRTTQIQQKRSNRNQLRQPLLRQRQNNQQSNNNNNNNNNNDIQQQNQQRKINNINLSSFRRQLLKRLRVQSHKYKHILTNPNQFLTLHKLLGLNNLMSFAHNKIQTNTKQLTKTILQQQRQQQKQKQLPLQPNQQLQRQSNQQQLQLNQQQRQPQLATSGNRLPPPQPPNNRNNRIQQQFKDDNNNNNNTNKRQQQPNRLSNLRNGMNQLVNKTQEQLYNKFLTTAETIE